jgi:hypothetical protein
MSFKFIRKGLSHDDIVAVVIDADDPVCAELVDVLMPNHDWQQYRDRGQSPIARGIVLVEGIVDYLCELVPDISSDLRKSPPEGLVRSVIMAEGSVSVYYIDPRPYYRDSEETIVFN